MSVDQLKPSDIRTTTFLWLHMPDKPGHKRLAHIVKIRTQTRNGVETNRMFRILFMDTLEEYRGWFNANLHDDNNPVRHTMRYASPEEACTYVNQSTEKNWLDIPTPSGRNYLDKAQQIIRLALKRSSKGKGKR